MLLTESIIPIHSVYFRKQKKTGKYKYQRGRFKEPLGPRSHDFFSTGPQSPGELWSNEIPGMRTQSGLYYATSPLLGKYVVCHVELYKKNMDYSLRTPDSLQKCHQQ